MIPGRQPTCRLPPARGPPARRLPPCRPSKVVCVGLNYRRHAEEMSKPLPEEPLIFLKPSTAVIADGEAIVLPRSSQMIHHEGELAVVIGTRAHAVAESRAMDHVAGRTKNVPGPDPPR